MCYNYQNGGCRIERYEGDERRGRHALHLANPDLWLLPDLVHSITAQRDTVGRETGIRRSNRMPPCPSSPISMKPTFL